VRDCRAFGDHAANNGKFQVTGCVLKLCRHPSKLSSGAGLDRSQLRRIAQESNDGCSVSVCGLRGMERDYGRRVRRAQTILHRRLSGLLQTECSSS
jgi:hypothetical protein